MNFRSIALAAALAAGFAPAFAADQTIDLSSGEASFIGTPTLFDGGDDVITFSGLSGAYNFVFSLSSQYVTGLTASVNGQAAAISSFGVISFGGLTGASDAPFVVTLTGTPGSQASYSGELSVTAVPEPETYALLLAGLGVVGFVCARRRG